MDLSFFFFLACVYVPFDSFWLDFMWVFLVFVYIYVARLSCSIFFDRIVCGCFPVIWLLYVERERESACVSFDSVCLDFMWEFVVYVYVARLIRSFFFFFLGSIVCGRFPLIWLVRVVYEGVCVSHLIQSVLISCGCLLFLSIFMLHACLIWSFF